MQPGDKVTVMLHHLPGLRWTVGAIGVIKYPVHETNFSKEETNIIPPIRPEWWIVSVAHQEAKNGYALARLPETHLAPHFCIDSCPKHACL